MPRWQACGAMPCNSRSASGAARIVGAADSGSGRVRARGLRLSVETAAGSRSSPNPQGPLARGARNPRPKLGQYAAFTGQTGTPPPRSTPPLSRPASFHCRGADGGLFQRDPHVVRGCPFTSEFADLASRRAPPRSAEIRGWPVIWLRVGCTPTPRWGWGSSAWFSRKIEGARSRPAQPGSKPCLSRFTSDGGRGWAIEAAMFPRSITRILKQQVRPSEGP
jgi:hypothetical protein